jgi:putative FmdB family regulatory protein
MPIYEYACRKCDQKFDKLVRSMISRESVPCPHCGSKKTARLFSSFAVGADGAPRASSSAAHGPSCACCHGGGTRGGQCPMGGF